MHVPTCLEFHGGGPEDQGEGCFRNIILVSAAETMGHDPIDHLKCVRVLAGDGMDPKNPRIALLQPEVSARPNPKLSSD